MIRSLKTESFVRIFLEKAGWQILYHNVEIARVQVDLLARSPAGLLSIIEVKTNSRLVRLSPAQCRRLFRVARVLSGYEPVQLLLAISGGCRVQLLPVDALTL